MTEAIRSTSTLALTLALGLGLAVGPDADALAAQQPESQSDDAAVEEAQEADTPDGDGATKEAVGVSGHWTLEVRNPDGTLDERVEFENHLTSPGTWAQVMAGTQTSGAWLIHVPEDLCADVFGTSGDGSPTSCSMHEPGTGPFEESNEDLSITVPSSGENANDIVLSASFEADFDGSVGNVETQMNTCDPGVSPDVCTGNQGSVPALTQKSLSSPVSVTAGQQVLIEVVLSFDGSTLQ